MEADLNVNVQSIVRKRHGFNRNKMTGEVWHTYVTREMFDIGRITSWQQKLIHRWTIHIKINNTVNFTFSKIDYSAVMLALYEQFRAPMLYCMASG